MKHLIVKATAAASAALLGGLLLAPSALADVSCTISRNGAGSHNSCHITLNSGSSCHRHRCGGVRVRINNATVSNGVWVVSNTGGNTANKNTGGNVSISSGDSNVNVTITNTINQ